MNWLKIGWMVADRALVMLSTLGLVLIVWIKYMRPQISESLEEAARVTKKIASLGGIKRADYADVTKMENLIGSKLVSSRMPELEGIKLLLGSETAAELDAFIENNPTAAMQLYEKYKHFLPGGAQGSSEQTTDF